MKGEKGLINTIFPKADLWQPTVLQEQTSQLLGNLVLFRTSAAFAPFYIFLTLTSFLINNKQTRLIQSPHSRARQHPPLNTCATENHNLKVFQINILCKMHEKPLLKLVARFYGKLLCLYVVHCLHAAPSKRGAGRRLSLRGA